MAHDTIIRTNGTQSPVSLDNPRKGYDLKTLQTIVGGSIEIVRIPVRGMILVVNENGLSEDLPFNPVASQIAGQPIVGDALLCDTNHVK